MSNAYSQKLNEVLSASLATFATEDVLATLFRQCKAAQTALAGGGATGATAITAVLTEFTTVANAGDSALLPAAYAGGKFYVINNGAASMTVYPSGTDTINGTTSLAIGVGAVATFICAAAGKWMSGSGTATGSLPAIAANAVTANSGGTKAGAFQLTAQFNNVATVAADGDSVLLPLAAAGLWVVVENNGAHPMQVFGKTNDTINGIATATGVSQPVGTTVVYFATAAGAWITLGSGLNNALSLLAANGAINPHTPAKYMITKAGSLAALTLAAPTAGNDDGVLIEITSASAFAHTLTATGLFIDGAGHVNVATWSTNAGGYLRLRAYNAKWYVEVASNVTMS